MGNRLYNLLGYGTLEAPFVADDDRGETLEDRLYDIRPAVRRAYETEPDYLVVRVAVDDPVLQKYWGLAPLADEVLRCAPRRARYAPDIAYTPTPDVTAAWNHAIVLFAEYGLVLPAAQVVVLNDWD